MLNGLDLPMSSDGGELVTAMGIILLGLLFALILTNPKEHLKVFLSLTLFIGVILGVPFGLAYLIKLVGDLF